MVSALSKDKQTHQEVSPLGDSMRLIQKIQSIEKVKSVITSILLMLALLFSACSDTPTPKLEDYLQEQSYAPPQKIGFNIVSDSTFIGDSIEFIIPDSYQTREPMIDFLLKDTLTGVYIRESAVVYKIRNGRIRYGLDYTFENYDNLEIGDFWLWDPMFIVLSGRQIERFRYRWDAESESFKYAPNDYYHSDRYLILDFGKMTKDGNLHLMEEFNAFLSDYIAGRKTKYP